jgi:hypothetical protein
MATTKKVSNPVITPEMFAAFQQFQAMQAGATVAAPGAIVAALGATVAAPVVTEKAKAQAITQALPYPASPLFGSVSVSAVGKPTISSTGKTLLQTVNGSLPDGRKVGGRLWVALS